MPKMSTESSRSITRSNKPNIRILLQFNLSPNSSWKLLLLPFSLHQSLALFLRHLSDSLSFPARIIRCYVIKPGRSPPLVPTRPKIAVQSGGYNRVEGLELGGVGAGEFLNAQSPGRGRGSWCNSPLFVSIRRHDELWISRLSFVNSELPAQRGENETLQAVVKETLRLHPPAPFLLPRKAENDVQLCGYQIPKGSQLLVNAWAINRDPGAWCNPSMFLPERFLESEIDFRDHQFNLMSFGAGRRVCPGLPLADRILHLMLANLIHSFNWKLGNGMKEEDVDMTEVFGLSLHKAKPLLALPVAK